MLGNLKDLYAIWEYKTPFKRTSFVAFQRSLNKAEITDGKKGFVTIGTLATELKTNVWQALRSTRSNELKTMLVSDAFKDPKKNLKKGEIDKNCLLLYAILHCQDSKVPKNKARALYEILQDGGFQRHPSINWKDKDIPPTLQKLCTFATTELFGFCSVKQFYTEEEKDKLRDVFEYVQEELWVDKIWGDSSTLANEEWLNRSLNEDVRFIFNAKDLRQLIFKQSGVKIKHVMREPQSMVAGN